MPEKPPSKPFHRSLVRSFSRGQINYQTAGEEGSIREGRKRRGRLRAMKHLRGEPAVPETFASVQPLLYAAPPRLRKLLFALSASRASTRRSLRRYRYVFSRALIAPASSNIREVTQTRVAIRGGIIRS